jgi:hypothetical protein
MSPTAMCRAIDLDVIRVSMVPAGQDESAGLMTS